MHIDFVFNPNTETKDFNSINVKSNKIKAESSNNDTTDGC